MHCNPSHRRAFTIFEMALVLTIIALIVGGIIGGLSLKRTSQVRAVLTDAQTYASAIQQFHDKFGAYPGDMADAERIWGTVPGGCPTGISTDKRTCNGNGDGVIESSNSEQYRAWQQLAAAGLIKGSYCGISTTSNPCAAAVAGGPVNNALTGVNIPGSSIASAGFYLDTYGTVNGTFTNGIIDSTSAGGLKSRYPYPNDYSNALFFGSERANNPPQNPALTTQEAYSIDKKVDDGLPFYGNIVTYRAVNPTPSCMLSVVSATSTTYAYNTTVTDTACVLIFLSSFGAKIQ